MLRVDRLFRTSGPEEERRVYGVGRASVINFLKNMAEKGVLTEERKTGKGGYHGIYYQKYSESEFKQYLAEHFIRKLLKEFPEETRKVIEVSHWQ